MAAFKGDILVWQYFFELYTGNRKRMRYSKLEKTEYLSRGQFSIT